MSIIRSLESFSLPELFQLIENESKTGRLIVEPPISPETDTREGIYYIWFKDGYLIAISNCLNQKGLIDLIAKRGWISPAIVSRLRTLCPTAVPLGAYLHKMKLLSPEKISLVFQLQLHQVYRLFQLVGGRFRFDDYAELPNRILTIPWLEMTGHRIKTKEVSMYALRLMENSDRFVGQLPLPNQILRRIVDKPNLKLTTIERKLWNLADSTTSLIAIARTHGYPLEIVQMTAFRLIAVGLVDVIFQPKYDWEISHSDRSSKAKREPREAKKEREISFLDSLGVLFRKHS